MPIRFWPLIIALALVAAACASSAHAPEVPTASGTGTAATPTVATLGTISTSATPAPTEPPLATTSPVEPARVVYRGDPSRRAVALTFDAGSDTGYTALILDILRREGVRATFGLTGLWAEANRELTLAIAADGHEIINHSYSHRSLTGLSSESDPLSAEDRALEMSRTETTIYRLTSRSTRPYFRPPLGDVDESVQIDAAANGYSTLVMWTVDTRGWQRIPAEDIVARSLELAEPGAIYVLHVGSESQDAVALERIIAGLRADGYAFETIDELLRP